MEKREELKQLLTPLMEWMKQNCDPHTILIVDQTGFDLYQASSGVHYPPGD